MADEKPLPSLSSVIARHGLAAQKQLGQHYLLDGNITAKIARSAGALASGTTIEIGPGPGGLTRALLASGARQVLAIELDARCLPALSELADAYPGRLAAVHADALSIDPIAEAASRGLAAPYRIVANLPYNVATALLLRWLAQARRYEAFVLMFQREVAQRLTAAPRTKSYGRLSVMTQWRCSAERLFDLPPGAFVPPPAVHSTVLRLVPRPRPLAPAEPDALERVVAAAFGQRRKMLRSSLASLGVSTSALLAAAGIAPTRRAEELSVGEFCALARAWLEKRPARNPVDAAPA